MSSTVRRIGPVLDLFTAECPEWTAAEIAGAIGVSRSTGHALVVSLAEVGLLRLGPRGRYRVGWRALELSGVWGASSALLRCAAPVLDGLAERTGESVVLAVLRDRRALLVDVVPGARPVAVTAPAVGGHCALGSTAVGKVLLSGLSRPEARVVLRPEGSGPAPGAGAAVLAEVEQVRDTGVAVEVEEAAESVCGIAAPVTGEDGAVIAALGLLLPAARFRQSQGRLAALLRNAADQVTTQLLG